MAWGMGIGRANCPLPRAHTQLRQDGRREPDEDAEPEPGGLDDGLRERRRLETGGA
jgi:hypothetical protein